MHDSLDTNIELAYSRQYTGSSCYSFFILVIICGVELRRVYIRFLSLIISRLYHASIEASAAQANIHVRHRLNALRARAWSETLKQVLAKRG